ncbi:MAG: porin family protein [Chitinophagales bacterium]
MKKLIVLSVFIALGMSTYAQKGLHLGVKAIPQSTWMFNNADADNSDFVYRSTFRSAFGLDVDYHFTDGVGAGINLLFSGQGQKFRSDGGLAEGFRKLTYLKLPILLNFNTSSESVVMFKGSLGPQFAFPIKGTLETNGTTFFGTYSNERDIKDYYKVDIGIVFGFGLGFNITDYLQASLGLRFDAGFTSEDTDMTNSIGAASPGDIQFAFPKENNGGLRGSTTQVTGGVEIGFKYILRMD